ncbi:MAG: carboxymuconolactone decarboxylase family protein [archaeon]|nr:carboxymuconolactone decarboxylase family protein [archaeon]
MEHDPELVKEAERRIAQVRKALGKVPVVNQVLSERPDLFIANFDTSSSIFDGEKVLDHKTKHLLALSAAVAYGSPYCIRAQMEDAIMFGATRDEILETLQIAAYMGITRAQSNAFRVFADVFDKKLE